MISYARILAVPVLLFSLAACGLKGPLYLPDARREQVAAPAIPAGGESSQPALEGSKVRMPLPAPQSQKKDRERSDSSATSTTTPAQSTPPSVSQPDPDRPAETTPPQGQ